MPGAMPRRTARLGGATGWCGLLVWPHAPAGM